MVERRVYVGEPKWIGEAAADSLTCASIRPLVAYVRELRARLEVHAPEACCCNSPNCVHSACVTRRLLERETPPEVR